MERPAGVVLTGGSSTRMGADKALVAVDGVPMARRVADALAAGGCRPVRCQGGDRVALAALGLEVVADDHANEGPLHAIVVALRSAAPADVVVSACDLPDLDAATVAALIGGGAANPHALVVVAADLRGPHLVSWWRASAAAPLAALLDVGVRSYREAVERLGGVEVAVTTAAVRNVNRPGDVAREVSSQLMVIAEISVDELADRLAAGARLVDVRETDEYDEAHVPGALLVPLGTVPDHVDAFRGEGATYVICRSGARSMRACEFVAQHGIEVVNVAGGTMAWLMTGREHATGAA